MLVCLPAPLDPDCDSTADSTFAVSAASPFSFGAVPHAGNSPAIVAAEKATRATSGRFRLVMTVPLLCSHQTRGRIRVKAVTMLPLRLLADCIAARQRALLLRVENKEVLTQKCDRSRLASSLPATNQYV